MVAKKPKKPEPPENHERWLVSFADYMTLLFALFVVLYSFAMAKQSQYNSMVKAFMDSMGQVGLISRPAGSPVLEGGTGILEIQKDVSVETKEITTAQPIPSETPIIPEQAIDLNVGNAKISAPVDMQKDETAALLSQQKDQEELLGKLRNRIENKRVEIEALGQQVIIRINDKGLFPAGSANLQPQFKPLLLDIAQVLSEVPGEITVTGHTDDSGGEMDGLYSSNWHLSALRAVSVVEQMLNNHALDARRVIAQGRSDKQPRYPNDSEENRAKNRRIEIAILQGKVDEGGTLNLKVKSNKAVPAEKVKETSSETGGKNN
jgi:chemotaxis protein MotB